MCVPTVQRERAYPRTIVLGQKRCSGSDNLGEKSADNIGPGCLSAARQLRALLLCERGELDVVFKDTCEVVIGVAIQFQQAHDCVVTRGKYAPR